jgi:ABC-2 type transport system ATP-binding protein/ribosome-dependent ATPase
MTTPLAASRGVTRRFGAFAAVDDVDLSVAAGEVVGLLGANGAGKTTLIRMLLGLLQPSSGEVELFGRPPSRRTRRRLGYVPQGLGLYADLTPSENLAFARSVFEGDAERDGGSAGGPATAPGVPEAALGVPVGELPLGVQRRVAFAQALRHRPDLLVLDEPTSGVDPLARARLWEAIRDAADAGAGVLVTTHHMDEAEECDRLVVMAGGRVVAAGTTAEVVGDATVVTVDTSTDWGRAFAALDGAGLLAAPAGRRLRVPGAGPDEVTRALTAAGVDAVVGTAAASLEERFFELAR